MTTEEPPSAGLQELARRERGLDAEARARVLASVRDQGPSLVKRARLQRQLTHVASGLAVVVLAVGGAWWLRGGGASAPLEAERPALAEALPCEGRALSAASFRDAEGGERILDLGERAFVRADAGSVVSISELESCRLVLALERGRVDVHARDLGAGELLVTTLEAQVRVRGTIFSVARADDAELTVEVAEGQVDVSSADEPPESLRPRQRLRRRGRVTNRTPLDGEAEHRLLVSVGMLEAETEAWANLEEDEEDEDPKPRQVDRRRKRRIKKRPPSAVEHSAPEWAPAPPPARVPAVDLTPAASEPPPETLDTLLALAERLKRSGDLNGARRALRRAGEMSGPDAKAAWIALARLELQAGNTAEVRRAVREYGHRGGGPLEPEGAWIAVRAEERAGRLQEARAEASALIRRWPSTPQAEEARRWLARADAGSSP